jgi:hypothetical protein
VKNYIYFLLDKTIDNLFLYRKAELFIVRLFLSVGVMVILDELEHPPQ